jgi:5-methylthioadenosine/S-adenosylhomocysteine deaminase
VTPVDLLIHNIDVLCVVGDDMTVTRNAAIAVADGIITHVGPSADIENTVDAKTRRDLSGHLVMPGLINLHTHLPMTLLRGVAEGLDLRGFLECVWAEESRIMGPLGTEIGARLGAMEALLAGTTTALDMYFHPAAAHRGAVDTGIRHIIGPVFFSFPGPDGLSWSQRIAVLRDWPEQVAAIGGPDVPLALMPHAPVTVGPEYLRELAEYAAAHGFLVSTHASENTGENDETVDAYGQRPVALLRESGILDLKPVIAHAVRIDDEERRWIAEAGASVAHCPGSNLKLASGALDWPAKQAAGITVGLGTDGCASSNDLDMFSVMRLASNLARLSTHDPTVAPAAEVVRAATLGGAEALGMADRIGSIAVGKEADLIALSLDVPHLVPLRDPYVALVYSAGRSDVKHVWVAGVEVVRHGVPTTVDAGAVMSAARQHVSQDAGSSSAR